MVVALSACGLLGREDPRVEPERPATATRLTLIDPGAEPRRPVSFRLTPNTSVDLELRLDLHLTQRTSDTEASQTLDPPVTRQTVRLTVDRTDQDGSQVSFQVIDAGIDPAGTLLTDVQILQLTAAVQSVVGLTGGMHVDPRGEVTSVSYHDTAELPPESADALSSLEQGLTSVVPLLPSEPIGRGARWRTVSRSDATGLTLRQTTVYEVTSIEDDRLTYRATITQDAPDQEVDTGEGPVRLLAADLVGSTTGMVSTTGLVTESETSLRGSQIVEQTDGTDQEQDARPRRVTQDLDLLLTVKPVEAAEPAG